jgi:hypothetical protein
LFSTHVVENKEYQMGLQPAQLRMGQVTSTSVVHAWNFKRAVRLIEARMLCPHYAVGVRRLERAFDTF